MPFGLTVFACDGKQRNKITQLGEQRVKRTIISMLVSAALVVAPLPAMSADTGPLPAAPAAGVKQAQGANDINPPWLWIVGAGVVIGLGILVLANNNNSNSTPAPAPTTTTTGG